ncbi:flap endonuclease [Priestia megaterium]|uniref:5'-3' exonuclease n=1 Tax=Priestia TaxID=2800373 RepID=UPI000D51705F|nr:5'-3' exonuclease [Priestia megaterium]PVC74049.1 flap endonuclease [Priestia megaterium]
MNETLLVIDGFNLLSRCYFATSYGRDEAALTRNSKGQFTNALRVTIQKMHALIHQYEPSHIFVAWDVKREDTKRKDTYALYKQTRAELPDPLIQQYETLKQFFDTVGIYQMSLSSYEADDLIGALASKWSKEKQSPGYIYSNDRDLLQLLDQHISQIIAKKQVGDLVYGFKHFQEEYNIHPRQWVDVKALLGDKSDNIPGVPGVGEKAALPLIQQYGSINEIYAQIEQLDPAFNRYKKKLAEGKELGMLSRELAEIIIDIQEISMLNWGELTFMYDYERWNKEIQSLELNIRIRS